MYIFLQYGVHDVVKRDTKVHARRDNSLDIRKGQFNTNKCDHIVIDNLIEIIL